MDLSHIKKGVSFFYNEMKESLNVSEEQLNQMLMKNMGRPGFFELEYSHANSYFSIPIRSFILREKAYGLDVLVQRGENMPMQLITKIAARCGVHKARTLKYGIDDLIRFSKLNHVEHESDLTSLRTKQFTIYEISVKRRVMSIFSRKRVLLDSGKSVPYNYHRIPSLMNK